MDNLFDLQGKVAVVTGSSRGIGRAIALRLAQHGAKLVISSRKAEACETVAEEIRANGGEAIVQPCNVSVKAQLQALADAAMKQWGRIDILVRSEEHTSELQSLMRISDAVFFLEKKTTRQHTYN